MKPIKFKKKLRFHKETIADLNNDQLRAAHGGEYAPPDVNPNPLSALGRICPLSKTACQTQCPSTGDSLLEPCCAYC